MDFKYPGILLLLLLNIGFSSCSTAIDPSASATEKRQPEKVHKDIKLDTASSTVIVSPNSSPIKHLTYANHYPYLKAIALGHQNPTNVGLLKLITPTIGIQKVLLQPQVQIQQQKYLVPVQPVAQVQPATTFTFPTYHLGYHSYFGRNYNYANFGYSGIYRGNGLPLYNGFRPLGLYTQVHAGGNTIH